MADDTNATDTAAETGKEPVKDTTVGTDTASKTKELIAAAKARNQLEQKKQNATTTDAANLAEKLTPEAKEQLRENGELLASANVQSRANTLTGVIDPEAMGDVKGDGGDAKNYDDADPAKRLGIPTYIHGLGETNTAAPDNGVLLADRPLDAQTNAEMEAGRAALSGRSASSAAEQAGTNTRTFVTDPEAEAGKTPGEPAADTTETGRKKR